MPRPKGITDAQWRRIRKCERDFTGDGNKHAICRASVLHKGRKKAMEKRLRRKKR